MTIFTVALLWFGTTLARAASGELDASFGKGGKVTVSFPIGSYGNAVAIQPDGKILAVGAAAGSSETGEFAVARYTSDGSLDSTFGEDGMITTAIAGGEGDEARSLAIQPNGKIVVTGTDSEQRFAVVRYLSDGALDPSFGGNGIVRTNLSPGMDIAYDVALQSNGRIVVAGVENGPSKPYFAVVRYRSNGTLDATFAEAGKAFLAKNGTARALAIQSDGKIVITGYRPSGLTLARLLPDGSLDQSFSGNGIVGSLWDSGAYLIWPLEVALQANGKMLVAGDYDIFRSGIARFTASGKLDTTFSGDGVAVVKLGSNEQGFSGLAIEPNGRIVAAGYVTPHEFGDTTIPHIVVARLLRTGVLDDSWGGDGKVGTYFPGGCSASDVALQADGKAVVVGRAGNPSSMSIVRYLN
jgi:uncharacterized delta-60 repeat protein